jgi:hypothetical protein
LVPVTNGSIPEAPEGGQSTHAGIPLEGAAVALPDDPPGFLEDAEAVGPPPGAFDWTPGLPPPEVEPTPLVVDRVAVAPVVVAGVD